MKLSDRIFKLVVGLGYPTSLGYMPAKPDYHVAIYDNGDEALIHVRCGQKEAAAIVKELRKSGLQCTGPQSAGLDTMGRPFHAISVKEAQA